MATKAKKAEFYLVITLRDGKVDHTIVCDNYEHARHRFSQELYAETQQGRYEIEGHADDGSMSVEGGHFAIFLTGPNGLDK